MGGDDESRGLRETDPRHAVAFVLGRLTKLLLLAFASACPALPPFRCRGLAGLRCGSPVEQENV